MRNLIIGLLSVLLLTGCEKFALVRQMNELCKKDAGVKIYNEVKLPRDRFDKFGNLIPLIPYGNGEEISISRRYFLGEYGEDYESKIIINGKTDGSLEGRSLNRYRVSIVRTKDNKIMGEKIDYGVTTGTIWYELWGGASCPSNNIDLRRSIFKPEN